LAFLALLAVESVAVRAVGDRGLPVICNYGHAPHPKSAVLGVLGVLGVGSGCRRRPPRSPPFSVFSVISVVKSAVAGRPRGGGWEAMGACGEGCLSFQL
jgi:hypothetical protein